MGPAAFAVAETLPPPHPRAPASRGSDNDAFDQQVDAVMREEAAQAADCNENCDVASDQTADAPENDVGSDTLSAPPAPQLLAEIASPIVLQILSPQETGDGVAVASTPPNGSLDHLGEVAGAAPRPEPASADTLGKAVADAEQRAPQAPPPRGANASAEANAVTQAGDAAPATAKVEQTVETKAAGVAHTTLAAAPPVRPEPTSISPKQTTSAPIGSEKADGEAEGVVGETRSDAAPAAARAHATKAGPVERAAPSIAHVDPQAPAPAPAINTLTNSLSPTLSTHVSMQQAETEQAAAQAAPATAQVAREIVRRFDGGNTRFELRLDPPELGRVEVRLDVSRDHRVTAVVAADSPQALAELMRHARDLEQSLQSAGLELTENGLSFDLRQGAQDAEDARDARSAGGEIRADIAPEAAPPTARPLGYERWRGVRIDMMV